MKSEKLELNPGSNAKEKTNGATRILVVEDDTEAAALASALLTRKLGAQVNIASDITAARKALAKGEFQIILLDYNLPDGNGIDFLKELTAGENHPSVIMVTGQGDEKIAAEAFRGNASGYVVKDKRLPVLLPEVVGSAMGEVALRRSQEALRRSEEVERALLNATTDGVFMIARDGTIIALNRGIAETFGLALEEASGRSIYDLLPADLAGRRKATFDEVFATGKPVRFEDSLEGRWYDVSAFPLFDQDRLVDRVAVYNRDITDRKKSEEEIRQARDELEDRVERRTAQLRTANDDLQQEIAERMKIEESLKNLAGQVRRQAQMLDEILSTSPDQFYLLDGRGKLIYASRTAANTFGFEQEKMSGKYWLDLGFTAEATRPLELLREAVFSSGESRSGEIDLETVTGSRDFEFIMNPIRNPDGEVTTVVATARDITEPKRERGLLKRRAEEMSERAALLDLIPSALLVRDASGRIVLWNRGSEDLYGYSRDDALGTVSHELLQTEFSDPLDEIEEDIINDGYWRGTLVHYTHDGERIEVDSYWAQSASETGELLGILEVNTPIGIV